MNLPQPFFELIREDNLALWYTGVFSDELTQNLIDLSEFDISDIDLGKSRKKVSFLMAESFQNIVRHGVKSEQSENIIGTFGITNRHGLFHIFSNNFIPNDQAKVIEDKLNFVNEMDSEELRTYYKEMLLDGSLSEKGGAGLGLIEMARKSGSPLQYNFLQNGRRIAFALQIDYALKGQDNTGKINPIENSIALSNELSTEGVLILFKGDFKPESTNNVLEMLHENMHISENLDRLNKQIFHVGVELIQNMSRHGSLVEDKIEGIFALSFDDGEVSITAQNLVPLNLRAKLESHLEEINSKTEEELSNWYQEKLKTSALDDSNYAGIGLIDIGRTTDQDINYSFEDDGNHSLYTISVKLKQN
ncbi:SiaB family protein kinase [bacterium AH-315-C20]|nr:SiaB family protein kinase [bacterium AH-315-C20]